MKVGDLVEIYRHIPKYESAEIPVGKMDMGVIIGIEHRDRNFPETAPGTIVSYVSSETGCIESEWIDKEASGVIVTMKVISESR